MTMSEYSYVQKRKFSHPEGEYSHDKSKYLCQYLIVVIKDVPNGITARDSTGKRSLANQADDCKPNCKDCGWASLFLLSVNIKHNWLPG